MTSAVSILLCVHNGIEFLHNSIKSIIMQTHKDWELLIGINGLPIDKSSKIIKSINKLNDRRIRAIIYLDRGKCKTLNALIKEAKYNIIALIDVDDIWSKNKLATQLKYIEKYDVVGSNCQYFGDRIMDGPDIFLGELSKKMFTFQNPVVNSSVIMKKNNINWNEDWEGLDDYNLWIDLLNKDKTFYNVSDILTYHRIHEKSFYHNFNKSLGEKLLEDKIEKITEEERVALGEILDNKNWIL